MTIKISELTAAGPLAGTEELPLVQSSATRNVTAQTIKTWVRDDLGTAALEDSTTFAKPVDANTWTGEQTFTEYSETVAAVASSSLDPANGTIQTLTLTAATTLTDALTDGQSLLLDLSGGDAHAVTWPTITWMDGAEPILTARDHLQLYKIGTTLFGVYIGSVA